MSLLEWIQTQWLAWKLLRTPIYRAAIDSVRDAIENKEFADISTEAKGRISQQLLGIVTEIANAPIPAVRNREALFDAAHELTKYDVLDVTVERRHEHYFVGNLDGVTGEVGDRIVELVGLDSDLSEALSEAGADLDSKEDLHAACRAGYLVSWLAINAYGAIRRDVFNDFHKDPERDWVRPLIQSLYVWHESQYRDLLDMPPAPNCDKLQVLEVSGLANIVLDGAKDPLSEWEERYGRKWGEPRQPEAPAAL